MPDRRFVLNELRSADGPSRRLDAFIAEAIGWKRRSPAAEDGRVRKKPVLWVVPSGDEYGTVPRYTAELDAAAALASQISPDAAVALAWKDGRGVAMIGQGARCEAATPALALCLATLLLLPALSRQRQ
jgi:hypothetical protein